jgi:hypothetical protein
MEEGEFIKFKFEISIFCPNVNVKITSFRTAVWQLTNTLTVGEFSKWIVELDQMSMIFNTQFGLFLYFGIDN